jgi:hypothetical protein
MTITRYLCRRNRKSLSDYIHEHKPRVLSQEMLKDIGWTLPSKNKQKRFLSSVALGITTSKTHFAGVKAIVIENELELTYKWNFGYV